MTPPPPPMCADKDLLLTTPLARRLYHEVARDLPLIDYHCHLDPQTLAEDRQFQNLTQLWITCDPYKHRAMRIAGVPEHDITGPAPDRTKFDRWAATAPLTLGNPLHTWTSLELRRAFGIETPLTPATADPIWRTVNDLLRTSPAHTARGLLEQCRTTALCTSDRLLDDLSPHAALARSGWTMDVRPSLRGDCILATDTPGWSEWVRRLGTATSVNITDPDAFLAAIRIRLDAFDALGCRLADHACDPFAWHTVTRDEFATLLTRRLASPLPPDPASPDAIRDTIRLRSGLLLYLGTEYARRGWIMQLHLGAQRHTSTRLRRLLGPAGGYAGIGAPTDISALCHCLDDLEQADALPRTILYPLHPADYAPFAALTGSYVADHTPGLIQFGPAWWHNDHAHGIRAHLDALSSIGLLATFIGMNTDSRSLLSQMRHDYFRRVFCDWLGERAAAGHFPSSPGELAPLVRAVCHDNAARALRLPISST
ncbi:glucuronate isomerase [Opitutaceae bacterium TAV4]|nr:glucuronate isomerase [Opitutaceae bacterium TAV4]